MLLLAQLQLHIHEEFISNLALANNDKKLYRDLFQCIASAEFLNEMAYGFFQFCVSYNGLISFGFSPDFAIVIALILSFGDFLSNVSNFSPANDANDWLFTTRKPLKTKHYKYSLLLLMLSL